jgi:ATP-dependent DNA helicase RecQ
VPTRREADELAFRLCRRLKQRVSSYHAGLPPEARQHRQRSFLAGALRTMVATSAFGMGIDKPDVRIVLHARPPRSLEDYVQEAGRASRDGRPAVCCLIAAPADQDWLRREATADGIRPERRELRLRRLDTLDRYMAGRGCRRDFLTRYFGAAPDRRRGPCCDRCNRWRWGWLA